MAATTRASTAGWPAPADTARSCRAPPPMRCSRSRARTRRQSPWRPACSRAARREPCRSSSVRTVRHEDVAGRAERRQRPPAPPGRHEFRLVERQKPALRAAAAPSACLECSEHLADFVDTAPVQGTGFRSRCTERPSTASAGRVPGRAARGTALRHGGSGRRIRMTHARQQARPWCRLRPPAARPACCAGSRSSRPAAASRDVRRPGSTRRRPGRPACRRSPRARD